MLVQPRFDNHSRHTQSSEKAHDSERGKALWNFLKQVIRVYGDEQFLSDSEKANFAETLPRAYKAWTETEGLDEMNDAEFRQFLGEEGVRLHALIKPKSTIVPALTEILETGFPLESTQQGDCGIITQGPIKAQGLCPHHLLPVYYNIYVAYKPAKHGMVLGLSKLARVAETLASRPVLQEQVTTDIADALHFSGDNNRDDLPQIKSAGSAVQVTGQHSCMCNRGVMSAASTLSTVLRGEFQLVDLKNEFYQGIASIQAQVAEAFQEETVAILGRLQEIQDEIADEQDDTVDDQDEA